MPYTASERQAIFDRHYADKLSREEFEKRFSEKYGPAAPDPAEGHRNLVTDVPKSAWRNVIRPALESGERLMGKVAEPISTTISPEFTQRAKESAERSGQHVTVGRFFRQAVEERQPWAMAALGYHDPATYPEKLPRAAGPVTQFLGDVVTDPLSYITAPEKGITTLGEKALENIPKLTSLVKVGEETVPSIRFMGKNLLPDRAAASLAYSRLQTKEALKSLPGVETGLSMFDRTYRRMRTNPEGWKALQEIDSKVRGESHIRARAIRNLLDTMFDGLTARERDIVGSSIEAWPRTRQWLPGRLGVVQRGVTDFYRAIAEKEHEYGFHFKELEGYFAHRLDRGAGNILRSLQAMSANLDAVAPVEGITGFRRVTPDLIQAAMDLESKMPYTDLFGLRGEKKRLLQDMMSAGHAVIEAPFTKHRKYPGTLRDLKSVGVEMFIRDAHLATTIRGMEHVRVLSAVELLDGALMDSRIARDWKPGSVLSPNEALYIPRSYAVKSGQGHLMGATVEKPNIPALRMTDANELAALQKMGGGRKVPVVVLDKDVAQAISRGAEFFHDRNVVEKALLAWQRTWQQTWKGWTLPMFLPYHFRNAVGNFWNNLLAGMRDPGWYINARQLQFGNDYRASVRLADGSREIMNRNQLMEMAEQLSLPGRGLMSREGGGGIHSAFRRGSWWPFSANFKPIQGGIAAGTIVEDNAKLAHWLWRMDQGMDPVEASMSAKKYLFDYDSLTDTERIYFRSLLPFYTWTRKNVPLQVQMLFQEPGMFAGLDKALQATEGGVEVPRVPEVLPEWMADNVPIRIGRRRDPKTGKQEYLYWVLGSWLPAADLEKLFHPGFILDMVDPYLSEAIALIKNEDPYFSTKYEKVPVEAYPGEKKPLWAPTLLGKEEPVMLPAKVHHVVTKLSRPVAEAERFASAYPENPRMAMMRSLVGIKAFPLDIEGRYRVAAGRSRQAVKKEKKSEAWVRREARRRRSLMEEETTTP